MMGTKAFAYARRAGLYSSSALALGVALAGPALAQTGSVPLAGGGASASDSQVEQVVVTASRAARTGFTAPTPTTIVNPAQLEQRGATNIAQVLNEIPAFKASTTPATNGVRSIFTGSSYADMRGLGATRTLVLVDGKRYVPQVTTGLASNQVDLNQIPSLLIQRAEVVTGGASAQWGSDAVGGVVNLILKRDFEGFQADIQAGQSSHEDFRNGRVSALVGRGFMDGRLHVEAAVDYNRNNGVKDPYSRDWGRQSANLLVNPCPGSVAVSAACPTGGNGQANNLILTDTRYSVATNGGLINAGPLKGTQFLANGATSNFVYGNYVGAQLMQGGDPVNAGLTGYTDVLLVSKVKRVNAYTRTSFKFTPDITGYVEASYTYSHGQSQTLPKRNEAGGTALKIAQDNAYLPDAVRQRMVAANALTFDMGRNNKDVGNGRSSVRNFTQRIVAGLEGTFDGPGGDWKWDINYNYGKNRYNQRVFNNGIVRNFNYASDSVRNAAGQIVCGVTIPGRINPYSATRAAYTAADVANAAGCVPWNPFGPNNATDANRAFLTGTLWSRTNYTQNNATFNISGEPFKTWAGPVSTAAGLEWRKETQNTLVDARAAQTLFESSSASPLAGSASVKEGYLEAVVPLARDVTLFKALDVNGAIRRTDYKLSGAVTTWKVGGTWTPFEGLLLRAARSRDIRAPSLFELFTPQISTIPNLNIQASMLNGPTGNVPIQQLIGGNVGLTPEKANTFTVGFSASPTFIPGLQFSLDYYDIRVKDAIATQTTANISTFCGTGSAAQKAFFCSYVTLGGANGSAYTFSTNFQNFATDQRTGWDIAASYRTPLDRYFGSVPGYLSVNFSGNLVTHYRQDLGLGFVQRAGEVSSGATPRFNSTTTIVYEVSKATFTAQVRQIGSGVYNKLFFVGTGPNSINNNTVPGRKYLNLSASYKIRPQFEVFGVVNNVFDRDPPIAPQNFAFPTSNAWFDMIGRTYTIGLRYRG